VIMPMRKLAPCAMAGVASPPAMAARPLAAAVLVARNVRLFMG